MALLLVDGWQCAASLTPTSTKFCWIVTSHCCKDIDLLQLKAELAARLLEEEWPDASETAAAAFAERQARTPLPERVWALRNVAGTLALGGLGERARARRLLEEAVALKEEAVGNKEHPGPFAV